jgi:hypothetical protein
MSGSLGESLMGGGLTATALTLATLFFQWYTQRDAAERERRHAKDLEELRSSITLSEQEALQRVAVSSRRRLRAETWEEIMSTLRRPLLASANDLQSRLGGILALKLPSGREPTPFLSSFSARVYSGEGAAERSAADWQYAVNSTLHIFGEWFAIMEHVRTTVSYLSGTSEIALNILLEGIRFQFTGETPIQGAGQAGEDAFRLQLYAQEMRAMGEVMLESVHHKEDDHAKSFHAIGYAKFLDLIDADAENPHNAHRKHQLLRFQAAFAKLKGDVQAISAHPERRPKRRLNMLRVLLMRLIDELDPPSCGPTKFELIAREEEEARWQSADSVQLVPVDTSHGETIQRRVPGRITADADASGSPAKKRRLLLVPGDVLSGRPPHAAIKTNEAGVTGMPSGPLGLEVIPRDEFRWPSQYDASVADSQQAGCNAQLDYLRGIYAAMHRTKARGIAADQRRLFATMQLHALRSLQRRGDADIAQALPTELRGDAEVLRSVEEQLARLSRCDHLMRSEQLAIQLEVFDSLERLESAKVPSSVPSI